MAVVERRVVEHPEPCAEILGGIAAVREARIDAADRFCIERLGSCCIVDCRRDDIAPCDRHVSDQSLN